MISGRIDFKDGSSRDAFLLIFCAGEPPSPPGAPFSAGGAETFCASSFSASTLLSSVSLLSNDSSNIRMRFSFLYF